MSRRQDKDATASALAGLVAETTLVNTLDQQDQNDLDSHRESEPFNGPRWSTVQQPSHHFPHRHDSNSPAYLGFGLPQRSEAAHSSGRDESARMPDDTSTSGDLHGPTIQKPGHHLQHRQLSQQHTSERRIELSNSPYTGSSGEHSHSRGSPRSPSGSPDASRSSRDGSRGRDPSALTAHQIESLAPSSSAVAHSPNRRRTRVLMTRIQSEALNKLWSQTMFPSTSEREVLAQQIGLTARQVQVWFQNQRQKRRREREGDDIPQHEKSPDSQPHPSGWISSSAPGKSPDSQPHPSGWISSSATGYVTYQQPNHMPLVSRSSYPPPPHSAHFVPSQLPNHPSHQMSPLRSATHPPLHHPNRAAQNYRRELSPSNHPQVVGHSSENVGASNVVSPRSWRNHSPRSDHLSHVFDSGYSAEAGDSSPVLTNMSSRDSYFGPHRPSRIRSTSHSHPWPYQPGLSPPSNARAPLPSSPSQAFPFPRMTSSPAGDNPGIGPRRRTDGYTSRQGAQVEEVDLALNFKGSRSAPARSSALPPSLSSIVIDSPYESGAGPEATTLQPLNLHGHHAEESSLSPPWRPGDRSSPRRADFRQTSGGDEEGQAATHKRVADLLR